MRTKIAFEEQNISSGGSENLIAFTVVALESLDVIQYNEMLPSGGLFRIQTVRFDCEFKLGAIAKS